MREYTRVFQREPSLLAEMLALRMAGVPIKHLANFFEVDRTSIRYMCIKMNVTPITTLQLTYIDTGTPTHKPKIQPQKYKYETLLEENVNQGKNYKDYLREYSKTHRVVIDRHAPDPNNLYDATY